MNRDDTSFIPEKLDEQIEHPAEWLTPDDQHLTQDLRHTYQPYERANTQSLQDVWKRLEQKTQIQQRRNTAPVQITSDSPLQRKQTMKYGLSSSSSSRESLKRTLSLLVAAIVVAVLIGSAALLFNTAGKNHTAHINTNEPQATSTPVVNSPGIYITYPTDESHKALSKIDAQTHKPLWVYKGDSLWVETPVVYGDAVYFDATDIRTQIHQTHLIALDAKTGQQIWTIPFKANSVLDENGSGPFDMSALTTPVVSDGQIYVMNRSGTLFSFEAKTGKANWTYETGASGLIKQYYTDQNGKRHLSGSTIGDDGTPVISDGVLYGTLHNTYFAVNAKTGKRIWSFNLAEQEQIFNGIQVVDGVIYAASFIASEHHSGMPLQSYVYAFKASDGRQIWKYSTAQWVTSMPTVSDGRVYVIERIPDLTMTGNGQSTLRVLNIQGHEIWHNDYQADISGSPTVGEGYVSVNMNTYSYGHVKMLTHTLYVYGATGNKKWEKDVDASPISIQDGMLYAQSGLKIIAYDIKSQRVQWSGQYGADLVDSTGNHSGGIYQIVVVP